MKEGDIEFPLHQSIDAFRQVQLENGTLQWNNIPIESKDEEGNLVSYPYELDPIMLYEVSESDPSRSVEIGMMIKTARKELGLTQDELATRSGTSKHYISRIENNKSGIELSTLQKIIEGGLGKRLRIEMV